MRRSTLRIAATVAVVLVLAGTVYADPDPAPPSNTADVTGGIFEEANDVFLSPTEFSELEQHVLFLQFDMPSATLFSQGIELGGSADLFGLYTAGYMRLLPEGSNGLLGGDESQQIEMDQNFLTDGGGLITGKTEQQQVITSFNREATTEVRLLVGLGSMGIGLGVLHDVDNNFGSYTPAGSVPTTPTFPALGATVTAATATSFSTFDDEGNLVATNVQQYGLGTDVNSQLDITASFGMPLTLAGLSLAVGTDVLVGFRDDSESASFESYSRVVGSASAISYTPGQTIDGSDPVAIDDLTDYSYDAGMDINSRITIMPTLYADLELELNETTMGYVGLSYMPTLNIYSARYTDNAGAEVRTAGIASTYESTTVDVVVNPADPTLLETTTTTISGWDATEISGMTNTVGLEVGADVTPAENFAFGVRYSPTFSYLSETERQTGEVVETEIVDNGDGVNGVDDSVTRTTVSRAGTTTTVRNIALSHTVNTGAQFFLTERIRVNLGAQVDQVLFDRTLTETVTNGVVELTEEEALNTTDAASDAFTLVDYQFDTDVRANPDDEQVQNLNGSSSVFYEAGFTFFFSETMFLDLRMDGSGGDIWNTNEWSLEMTILY